jgi:hypothetical protein
VLSAPPVLKLKVKWRPTNYVFGGAVPYQWNAELFFAPPRPVTDIDQSTIKLEGVYSPTGPGTVESTTGRLIVPFDGNEVVTALLNKAGHLSPGEFRILLEITGNLNDGKPFAGSGGINLIVDSSSPP